MVGLKMFYNAEIAEQHGPEPAFFAFFKYFHRFWPFSRTGMEGNPLKSLFLSQILIYLTRKRLLNEYCCNFDVRGPESSIMVKNEIF